jgi:GTP cyclohydrolase I
MLDKLGAQQGRIEAAFSFFLRKRAPVSGVQSLLDYQGRWIAETREHSTETTVWAEVAVPVKSLCPCSKEISDYGAHNQRSLVTIRAEVLAGVAAPEIAPLGWQELVRFAEDQASSEIWPMLKRPDEKWVTEHAYQNPKFVEDLVRDVALALNADARIGRYRVDVENFESIHNHSAYARIERS